jgi:HSP20 family protein
MFALMPWRAWTERPLGEFNRLFGRLVSMPALEMPEVERCWNMTVEEKDNELLFRAELPGFAPEELHVELLAGRLTIAADQPAAAEAAAAKPEWEYARVRRVITLPPGIDPAHVEATYRNGVLEVHLPRTPEATPRRIEVRT